VSLARSATNTTTSKQKEYFSDFLDSFALSPLGQNLGLVKNEESVKQALKNLIKTNLGERMFQPNLGSNILGSLFELNSTLTLSSLEFYISNTIQNNEPRVNLISVVVESFFDDDEIAITIVFSLVNNPSPITLSFMLKRIR